MPRRPRVPPKTPLGAWLSAWLEAHPEWTHQALADEIGVSKGLISQWRTGDVKSIKAPNLQGLARVTGEPLENLERMVYGSEGQRVPTSSISPELLDAIEERIRRAFREELQAALRELRTNGASR